MQSGASPPIFPRNILPLSSGLRSKPRKKPVRSRCRLPAQRSSHNFILNVTETARYPMTACNLLVRVIHIKRIFTNSYCTSIIPYQSIRSLLTDFESITGHPRCTYDGSHIQSLLFCSEIIYSASLKRHPAVRPPSAPRFLIIVLIKFAISHQNQNITCSLRIFVSRNTERDCIHVYLWFTSFQERVGVVQR